MPRSRHNTGIPLALAARCAIEPLEARRLMAAYSITDLGTLGGADGSLATAINAAGIAGSGTSNRQPRSSGLTPVDWRPRATPAVPATPILRRPAAAVDLTVRYVAPAGAGIDASSVGSDDLLVTAADGTPLAVTAATLTGDGGGDGSPRLSVSYAVGAPGGGTWTAAHSGGYTVVVRPDEVLDTVGRSAATVTAAFEVRIDDAPPVATVLSPGRPDRDTMTFSVRFADDVAVDPASLGPDDLLVTAPDGTPVRVSLAPPYPPFIGFPESDAPPPPVVPPPGRGLGVVTGTYALHARTAPWDADDVGVYTVTLKAGGVRDLAGNPVPATAVGPLDADVYRAGGSARFSTGRGLFDPFGGGGSSKRVDFNGTDPDGTRFTLRVRGQQGGGESVASGTMYLAGDGSYDLDVGQLSSEGGYIGDPGAFPTPLTFPATRVTLTAKGGGDGRVRLRDVRIKMALHSFAAPAADLSGTFSIVSAAATPSITLGSFAGSAGAAATLASPATIRALNVLGPATHARVLAGADLGDDAAAGGLDGDADAFSAASILSLRIAGPVTASLFAAGLDPVNGTFGDGDDRVVDTGGSEIGSVRTAAGTDPDTRFVAGSFRSARVPRRIDPAADPRFRML